MFYYKVKDISTGMVISNLSTTCLMDAKASATPGKHEILVFEYGELIDTYGLDIHSEKIID